MQCEEEADLPVLSQLQKLMKNSYYLIPEMAIIAVCADADGVADFADVVAAAVVVVLVAAADAAINPLNLFLVFWHLIAMSCLKRPPRILKRRQMWHKGYRHCCFWYDAAAAVALWN